MKFVFLLLLSFLSFSLAVDDIQLNATQSILDSLTSIHYNLDYHTVNYDCADQAMNMLIRMDRAISLDPTNPAQEASYERWVAITLGLAADDIMLEIVGQQVWVGKEQVKDAIYSFAVEDEFRRTTNENRYYEVISGTDGVKRTVVHGEQQVFRTNSSGAWFGFNHADVHCEQYGEIWLPMYYRIQPGKEFQVA